MQATNSPTKYNGAARYRSSDGIFHAIRGSSTSSADMKNGRTYQRGWSKQRMKESRYSDSGSTQRNGTLEMFCVTGLVTASSMIEPIAGSASHRNCVATEGAPASSTAAAAAVRGLSSLPAALADIQPVAAHTNTNTP